LAVPAAHIAMMETEIVTKKRWVTRQQFLDMLGAANLVPGPTSTETAITVGFARAGWPGLCRWFPSSLRLSGAASGSLAAGALVLRPSVGQIGLFFLKVGNVLYGGGYVLLAFLEQGLVRQHTWLTRQQLLDTVAIGQFTPGPVLSTATFIGYILGGVPGAVVATVAIFLPSFFYVALLAPVLFRLRQSDWIAAFLDSVNACAVALMGGVTLRLGADALHGWRTWIVAGAVSGSVVTLESEPRVDRSGGRNHRIVVGCSLKNKTWRRI